MPYNLSLAARAAKEELRLFNLRRRFERDISILHEQYAAELRGDIMKFDMAVVGNEEKLGTHRESVLDCFRRYMDEIVALATDEKKGYADVVSLDFVDAVSKLSEDARRDVGMAMFNMLRGVALTGHHRAYLMDFSLRYKRQFLPPMFAPC